MIIMCCFFESFFFSEKGGLDFNMDINKLYFFICITFFFVFLWSVGGNLVEIFMDVFDIFTRDLFFDIYDVKVNEL